MKRRPAHRVMRAAQLTSAPQASSGASPGGASQADDAVPRHVTSRTRRLRHQRRIQAAPQHRAPRRATSPGRSWHESAHPARSPPAHRPRRPQRHRDKLRDLPGHRTPPAPRCLRGRLGARPHQCLPVALQLEAGRVGAGRRGRTGHQALPCSRCPLVPGAPRDALCASRSRPRAVSTSTPRSSPGSSSRCPRQPRVGRRRRGPFRQPLGCGHRGGPERGRPGHPGQPDHDQCRVRATA